jgi:hypothetical protein
LEKLASAKGLISGSFKLFKNDQIILESSISSAILIPSIIDDNDNNNTEYNILFDWKIKNVFTLIIII